MQARQTVRRDIHGVPRLTQCLRQIVAGNLVIFHNQNVHGLDYLTDVESVFVGTISFAAQGGASITPSQGQMETD